MRRVQQQANAPIVVVRWPRTSFDFRSEFDDIKAESG
ncbi:hypothetical protein OROMI_015990 [Orobanche minor]